MFQKKCGKSRMFVHKLSGTRIEKFTEIIKCVGNNLFFTVFFIEKYVEF